jgi:carboxymethylenebutenolidase
VSIVEGEGWRYVLHRGQARAGIVLIHEIFGLNDYIKSVAAELAKNGVWVAAPDLFDGKPATTLEEGFKLRDALKRDEVLRALRSGAQLLRREMGEQAQIGTMGFCMGGGFALLGACNLDFAFGIVYYGKIANADEVQGIKGPILVFLGSEDEPVNSWMYQALLPAANKYRKRVDLHLYPDAQHAFHRPGWEGHHQEAAKDAWAKTIQFLAQFR